MSHHMESYKVKDGQLLVLTLSSKVGVKGFWIYVSISYIFCILTLKGNKLNHKYIPCSVNGKTEK